MKEEGTGGNDHMARPNGAPMPSGAGAGSSAPGSFSVETPPSALISRSDAALSSFFCMCAPSRKVSSFIFATACALLLIMVSCRASCQRAPDWALQRMV